MRNIVKPQALILMKIALLFFSLLLTSFAYGQMPHILSMEQRAEVRNRWLEERFATVLPQLMDETGVDMWVIISREYNEDPVLKTMLPATWLSARRRTILVMHKQENGTVEGLAIARYSVGTVFKGIWNPEENPDQWSVLKAVIEERKPEKIAINRSKIYGLADGLVATDQEEMMAYLPEKYQKRLAADGKLAIRWLETRTESELAVYEQICQIGHTLIQEAFSTKVIQPGVTTTQDVVWWFRERIRELKLVAWFHPTVDVQRADPASDENQRSFSRRPDVDVIMPGDLIHCDVGITYLGLNTDMQELAYVLKPGETEAPKGLVEGLKAGNRLQDIMTGHFKTGISGNEILTKTIEQAKAEGLRPQIYSHPIGYHGHAAGMSVGLWDNQVSIPQGEHPLYDNTCYAIELNTRVNIPEWDNKEVRIMLEENAVYRNGNVHYMNGRQESLLLIPRQ